MGATVTMGWAYRRSGQLELAVALLRRGLRPSLVQEITGLPLGCCKELREEVAPRGAPPPKASIPQKLEGSALSSRPAREAASLLVPAYLALAGEEAERNICPRALVAAYDLHIRACRRLGCPPLSMDWAFGLARCVMDHEELVVQRCARCGGWFVPHANAHLCPACLRLRPRGRANLPESGPVRSQPQYAREGSL